MLLPPQLLFIHAGLVDPKEVRFHPQVVGLVGVTAEDGMDLFICEPLGGLVDFGERELTSNVKIRKTTWRNIFFQI